MKGDIQLQEEDAAPGAPAPAYARALDGLAEMLQGTLPTGSRLVVLWEDPQLGRGRSSFRGLPRDLLEQGLRAMQGEASVSDDAGLCNGWLEDGASIAIAAELAQPLSASSREGWLALARRTVATTLAQARAQSRIESLQKAQRLQHALTVTEVKE